MIDTHCHLFKEDYDNLEEVISNMDGIMVVAGTNRQTNQEVIELCKKYSNIYGVIGYHPEEVESFTDIELSYLESLLNNSKIVGIGEIGLDYHYTQENKEKQREMFVAQIQLAKKYHLPIVVHSRDAIQDTYQILKDYHIEEIPSIMHCYSSSLEMAYEFIKLKMKLGIGGVVTFKNSSKLKEIVENINLENIVLETDSPYLTPEPYRGKKNQPKYIFHIAENIAQLRNIRVEEVLEKTTKNAQEIFKFKD